MSSRRLLPAMGGDALSIQKCHQLPVVLGRDVNQMASGVTACGMGQCESAIDHVVGFEAAFDLHPVSGQQRDVGMDLKALRGQIDDRTEAGGSVSA